jgi:hypothetical protein
MLLPAVSIRQPWAHAIFHFDKKVENRSWLLPTGKRDAVSLVHAGKQKDTEGYAILRDMGFDVPHVLPCGGIVGIVEFDGCTYKSRSPWAVHGLCHWIIKRAAPLPFLPWKGQLSFFEVFYPYELPKGW